MNSDNGTGGSAHPKRVTLPSARLRDTENTATPELRSHQQAQVPTSSVPSSSQCNSQGNSEYVNSDQGSPLPALPGPTLQKRKHGGIESKKFTQSAHLTSDAEDQPSTSSQLVKGMQSHELLNLKLICPVVKLVGKKRARISGTGHADDKQQQGMLN